MFGKFKTSETFESLVAMAAVSGVTLAVAFSFLPIFHQCPLSIELNQTMLISD
jgi:hypothetical protein